MPDRTPGRGKDPRATAPDGLSRKLCEELARWNYDTIPADVLHLLKLFVLDTLGVIGGAAQAPGIGTLTDRLQRWQLDGNATALTTGKRLSPPFAALANGAAAHALDFDDSHDAARIHCFAVVLPALLAVAEEIGGIDGRRFLTALAVGAETHARLGLACYRCLEKGWHPTMTLGTMAGAVAVAHMMRQSPSAMLDALGLAHHKAAGSAQSMLEGVLSKRVGAGFASEAAVVAAVLASDGITGPSQPLEGTAGLFALHERGDVHHALIMEAIGERWHTRDYAIKPYPCCRCNHTAIRIALDLHAEGLNPDDVDTVDIWMSKVNWKTVGGAYDRARDSVVHAQFSTPYSFARALTDGSVTVQSYTRPLITDPAIAALAARIAVHPDPDEPASAMGPCRVRLRTRGGDNVERTLRIIPGSAEAPLSEADVVAKFVINMAYGLEISGAAVEGFARLVLSLEETGDMRDLVAAFPRS